MTDGRVAEGGAGDGRADPLDVGDELVRVDADAGVGLDTVDGVAVEVLAADGDADDELGEGVAVLVDGLLEGGDLVVHAAAGGPETEQEGGLLGDGGGDGGDGVVGGTPLDHGVETGAGEAGGADEVLGGLELCFKVGLNLAAAIDLGGAIVEALVNGFGGDQGEGEGDGGFEMHI